jgi:rhamnose transport system permease protein
MSKINATRPAPEYQDVAPQKSPIRRLFEHRETSLVLVLLALAVFFSALSPRFASAANFGQVMTDMSIVVIVGIGVAMVLFTRNIDVSTGSMVGLTAFFAADLAAKNPGMPLIFVVLASCGLGGLLGAINGGIVATLKVPSIMVTLGTLYIFRGIDSALAGANQVTAQNLSPEYNQIASWTLFGFPGIFVYALVIAGIAHIFIRYTYSGRSVLALGSNPLAAEKMGIASKKWIFGAFVLSGILSGFAGVLWGARYGTVDSSVATGFELVVLAAVVVGGVSVTGGKGSILGVIIGAAILSVIAIGLALLNVSQFWLQAIQGLVITAALVFDIVIRRRVEARSKGARS